MKLVLKTLLSALAFWGALGGGNERTASALYQGSFVIPANMEIPVPPGYGHYCSIAGYGTFGFGWSSSAVANSGDGLANDPCQQLINLHGGVIKRAGLYSINGQNNAMAHCSNGTWIARATGDAARTTVLSAAQAQGGIVCVITVSPTVLPIFGQPYDLSYAHADVSAGFTVFNYDVLNQATSSSLADWSSSFFGQPADPSHPTGCEFDRLGYQEGFCPNGTSSCLSACKNDPNGPAADLTGAFSPDGNALEGAYDWAIAPDAWQSVFITNVAPGVVVSAGGRNVKAACLGGCAGAGGCSDYMQQEVFIEHKVGHGNYEERFVSNYHHMAEGLLVFAGESVVAQDIIGGQGSTGCSSGPHLDFSVIRLTNLAGATWYDFQSYLQRCGSNHTCQMGACFNDSECNSGTTGTFGCDLNSNKCVCNSLICSSGETCQPNGSCGGTLKDPTGVNGIHGVIDPFGWDAPRQVDPWGWESIGVAEYKSFSPFPANVTAYGAFSIDLWKPNQAPPTVGDNPNQH